MKHGSTLFLKIVIWGLGLFVLAVCVIIIGNMIGNENAKPFLPLLALIEITAIPFFFALYQGLRLLRYIDTNSAFSERSVRAIQAIRYSALTISALYASAMPYIIYLAEVDDAPGAVLIGLVVVFAPLVVSVFAAVLEKLLQNAIDIQKENELAV